MGLTYMDQLERFLDMLAQHRILAMLDLHVLEAGKWPDGGGTGGDAGMATLREAWSALAERFCDPSRFWNIFAADLKNEPYAMYWGAPPSNAERKGKLGLYMPNDRWDTGASELGSHLHAACSRWLIVVEGVGHVRTNPYAFHLLTRLPSLQLPGARASRALCVLRPTL